jgi:glutamate synthase (NADPH/NADH) small chain
VDIPDFIKLLRGGEIDEAAKKIREMNSLPAICGRVCPQERLCMEGCRATIGDLINIGGLERFVADWEIEHGISIPEIKKETGKSVAIAGSGPTGLTAGAELRKLGYSVTIFEGLHEAGGVLMYGIPEFRLSRNIVRAEIGYIEKLGVKIETNVVVGRSVTLDELQKEFDAVFLATGAGLPKFLGIPGENLCGIFSLNEFLIRVNLMKAHEFPKSATPIKLRGKVVIVGSRGLDAARYARRLGAEEVRVLYQRRLVGRIDDIRRAKEEGIKFESMVRPIRFIGDERGWVKSVECVRLELGPYVWGKRKLKPIKGSEFVYDADTVVVAIGQDPNIHIAKLTPGIEVTEKKTIRVDPNTLETTRKGVFAGGDVATGAASVIRAIEAGKKASRSIDDYLAKK